MPDNKTTNTKAGQRRDERKGKSCQLVQQRKRTFMSIAGNTEDLIVITASKRWRCYRDQQYKGGKKRQQPSVPSPKPGQGFPPLHAHRQHRPAALHVSKAASQTETVLQKQSTTQMRPWCNGEQRRRPLQKAAAAEDDEQASAYGNALDLTMSSCLPSAG